MPAGTSTGPNDALTAARFSIVIDGGEIAVFSQLVGIRSEVEPDPLTSELATKLPGKRKPPTVTLRRGQTRDLSIFAWHESIGVDAEARKNCTLVMFDSAGKLVARYHLESAWPSTVEVGVLEAGVNDVLIETVTFTSETLTRIEP
jgi:phage tail-like protein